MRGADRAAGRTRYMRRGLIGRGRLLLAAACFGCAGSPGTPTPILPVDTDWVTLPTARCRDYFTASVYLNGAGPYSLILDSGAPRTVLDPDVVAELGLGSQRLDSIRSGGARAQGRIRLLVREMDGISDALGGPGVDGILGYDVFGDLLQVYDFAAGEVRVGRGRLPESGPGIVPMARGDRPFVRMRVGHRVGNLLIDTGFGGGLALDDFDELEFQESPARISMRMRITGSSPVWAGRLRQDVEVGDLRITTPIVRNAVGASLLGQEFMEGTVVTLDATSGRARFLTPEGAPPVYETREPLHGTGLLLVPSDEGFAVAAVVAGSPSDQAGVRVGDEITHIDGSPVRSRSCGVGGNRPGRTMYTLLRDGVELTVPVESGVMVR